jgi:hypothetical protein
MTVSPTTGAPQTSERLCHVPAGVLGCRLLGHWNGTGGSAVLNAVTFDLWQTLIVDTPEGLRQARADRVRGMAAVLAREGHAANDAAVDRAYDTLGERLETLWAEQRDLGSRGQVRMLLEALARFIHEDCVFAHNRPQDRDRRSRGFRHAAEQRAQDSPGLILSKRPEGAGRSPKGGLFVTCS